MKTWQMIKELTENPEKEFIRVGDPLKISVDYLNYLRWKPGHDHINLEHEWKEVKQPVTFMEAVESRKCIKVEHELIKSLYYYEDYQRIDFLMLELADDFTGSEFAEILENGKWYIED